jgi:hypothetical protein
MLKLSVTACQVMGKRSRLREQQLAMAIWFSAVLYRQQQLVKRW